MSSIPSTIEEETPARRLARPTSRAFESHPPTSRRRLHRRRDLARHPAVIPRTVALEQFPSPPSSSSRARASTASTARVARPQCPQVPTFVSRHTRITIVSYSMTSPGGICIARSVICARPVIRGTDYISRSRKCVPVLGWSSESTVRERLETVISSTVHVTINAQIADMALERSL